MKELGRILVVDDNASNVKALRVRLTAEGHEVLEALNGPSALEIVERERPDLVLLDIMMHGMDGYEVCRCIKEHNGNDFVPVVMVTAKTDTESIVRGLREGADEYIGKPFNPQELSARIQSMLRIRRMYQENTNLRQEIVGKYRFDRLIGQSAAMEKVYAVLPKVIESEVNVLLSGESGTGKEAVARTIHYSGARQGRRFVAVNCGALAPGLLESELFGHRKGAFTGAVEHRAGLFEAADGGTLFLDEIAETSPEMQVKLLRVLQEGEITPVGSSQTQKVDARIIAASNRDLGDEVKLGRFREDLYYRLSVFPIALPSLCQRREDIPILAQHFLQRHGEAAKKRTPGFSPEAMDALVGYEWPGNVRELENEIERVLVLVANNDQVGLALLSEKLHISSAKTRSWRRDGKLKDIMADLERAVIEEAYAAYNGNKTHISKHLGISRYTLLQKVREYGIE